jgi:hypothetical protein
MDKELKESCYDISIKRTADSMGICKKAIYFQIYIKTRKSRCS